jgi:hypothetical protein
MVTFVAISRHNAEVCAFHDEKSAKTMMDWLKKAGELEAKHGVKVVAAANVIQEHLSVQVLEAPTFEAFQAYSKEPEMMAMMNWNTIEIKPAMTNEEVAQMMQQMMRPDDLHFSFLSQ